MIKSYVIARHSGQLSERDVNVLFVVWSGEISEDKGPLCVGILDTGLMDDSDVFPVFVVDTGTCWYDGDWSFDGLVAGRNTEVLLPWSWEEGWEWCNAEIAGGGGKCMVGVNDEGGSIGPLVVVVIGTGESRDPT